MKPAVAHIASQFAQIESNDFRSIVKLYEEHLADILIMEDSEKNYYTFEYLTALFNLGRYEKVLLLIDPLIEFVFLNNVNYHHGSEGTYEWLIFKKSAALMNVMRFDEAERIAGQLVRMNPASEDYKGLYLSIHRQYLHQRANRFRGGVILLILSAAMLSMLAWSLKNTSGPNYVTNLFYISLALNISAVAVMGGHFGRVYWLSKKKLRQLLSI